MPQTVEKKRSESLTNSLAARSNFIFAAGLVGILATLLIPLPTFLLDIGLACSISLAIAVLVIVLAANEPIELSTFPSLLLFTTLFRLALNVASTRLILLQGDAGTIINTFGNFVAGGSLVVGMVMFIIILIIQFIVITKGATRISEVSARFVLDAMPGKQMAIDADLNAGYITEKEAKERRQKIVKESEFYGAMDGASKFIQGDAKAGLIITAVNLIGGIVLGYTHGMTIADAIKHYSILSIGDGLVSQIPSIIIAISSGFLVSKIRSRHTVSYDLTRQMLRNTQPLIIASVVIAAFALVPGFPKTPFLALGGICGYFAWSTRKSDQAKDEEEPAGSAAPGPAAEQEKPEEYLDVDVLSILVGVRLIGLVDPRKKSSVFDRIGALRKKFAQQLGLIIPLVRLRDNINLEPNAYEIRLHDHVIASGRIEPDRFLAMDNGTVENRRGGIPGTPTKEPVYGLPALWITAADKEEAEIRGYTVIDPESVLITHLSETLKTHAHELLSREDVQQLVDRLRRSQPSLVGEVVGEQISIGTLQRILQNLLKEGISIRDLPLILEAVGENAARTKHVALLTEVSRKALKRTITEQFKDATGTIVALAMDPAVEHYLISHLEQSAERITFAIMPEMAMELSRNIAAAWKAAMDKAYDTVVLLCDARIRAALYNMIERTLSRLPVVAYDEIVPQTRIEPIETITLSDTAALLSEHAQAVGV
ncbi:MAG TPA: flagellar biosynthesis protein FlhA [Anaerohalosphaeraceae bacterium]|jgi:flagellar biosynthesis protein FlhA|nr:flagellar biosynthesis protein FlhA [Anaerohalosphaeraceae bacterium]HRT49962.1 flagellar biosynthesis protein FlhA [Anaerohalosphaeraceae bacterium]HRT85740.1 flagellar biosynthesis protein FlhA [Anaerohalosphaeraceae bacterium]